MITGYQGRPVTVCAMCRHPLHWMPAGNGYDQRGWHHDSLADIMQCTCLAHGQDCSPAGA